MKEIKIAKFYSILEVHCNTYNSHIQLIELVIDFNIQSNCDD